MGAIEEGGKVAVGVVEGLKSQPLALALVLVNVLYMGFFVYIAHTMAERGTDERGAMMTQISTLLNKCFEVKDAK